MANLQGALGFDAYIANSDFHKSILEMQNDIRNLTKTANTEAGKIDDIFMSLGKRAAGAFAALNLAQLPGTIANVRGEFQQLEIAFTTMLGSKAKADKLLEDVTKFAATTPYGLKDTAEATKMLTAYGIEAGNVLDTLRMLGDVAAGVGAPLKDIAYLYGTTAVQGRMFTNDLNQFTNRGIPMIEALSKTMKIAESDVKAFVEAGKVGFPEMQAAFEYLTDAGSKFGGLMEAQSKSIKGLQAELFDEIDNVFNKIGKSNEDTISSVIRGTTELVKNYERIIDILKIVIATYGTYKAVLMTTAALQQGSAIKEAISNWLSYARTVKTATDVQTLFNLTVNANVYALAASAIALLVTGYMAYNREADKMTQLQDEINSKMADEKSQATALLSVINDENQSREFRNQKLQELIKLNPQLLEGLTLENIQTKEGTKAINEYTKALERQIQIEVLQEELRKIARENEKAALNDNKLTYFEKIGVAMQSYSGPYSGQSAEGYQARAQAALYDKNQDIIKQNEVRKQQILDRIKLVTEENKVQEKTAEAVVKNVAWYDKQIKELELQMQKAETPAQGKAIKSQIDALKRQRAAITGEVIKSEKEKADKVSKMESKSFADQLAEKKKMYEVYERWVINYSKQAADEQFGNLMQSGKSYMDWLDSEIARYEGMRDFQYAGWSDQDRRDLDLLLTEKSTLNGQKTGIDAFKEDLKTAKEEAKNLVEYLDYLSKVQKSLAGDKSISGREKAIITAQERIDSEKALRSNLESFLADVTNSEAARLAIEKKYAELRVALDREVQAGRVKDRETALAAIDKAEQDALTAESKKAYEKSAAYQALNDIIVSTGMKAIQTEIDRERAAAEQALKDGLSRESAIYKDHINRIKALEKELYSAKVDQWAKIADIFGQLGTTLGQSGGALGQIGNALSGIAGQAGNLSTILKDINTNGKAGMDSYAAAANSVIQIIGILISASQQRKAAEKEFYNSITNQKNEYNRALNTSIGLQHELAGNVFLTDYAAKMGDGIRMYEDALRNYYDALDELEGGRAKTGQRNKVDWGNVFKSAAAGATAGVAVGGPWGAAIGGVVGLVAGIFGGKKKKDVYGGLLEVFPELIDDAGKFNKALAETLVANNLVDDQTKTMLNNAIAWSDQLDAARDQIHGVISDLAGNLGSSIRDNLVTAFRDGTDAAVAFGQSVAQVLENIVAETLFSTLFMDEFNKLQDEMKASYEAGGDKSFVDDIIRFYETAGPKAEEFIKGLAAARDEAKKHGIDLFDPNLGSDDTSAPKGTIRGMSEETASVLVGQFNAVRIYQAAMAQDMRASVLQLATIAYNTSFNHNLERLVSIERILADMLAGQNGRFSGL